MLKTEHKGHIHDCGVMDAVLPQTILTPCITMIRAHQGVCVCKALEERSESRIHPLETGQLSPCALLRIICLTAEGSTWIDRAVPLCPLMPVRNVGLTEVDEYKGSLPIQRAEVALNEGELLIE